MMRQTDGISPIDVQAYLDRLDFINLTQEGDYATYPYRYLMGEA